jgi:hypothetical protein
MPCKAYRHDLSVTSLAAAYFEGDTEGLKRKIETRGPGTWKKWLDFLMDNNFKAANALLM